MNWHDDNIVTRMTSRTLTYSPLQVFVLVFNVKFGEYFDDDQDTVTIISLSFNLLSFNSGTSYELSVVAAHRRSFSR